MPHVRAAGHLIERVRIDGPMVRQKVDASPVTQADEEAEALLISAVKEVEPGTAVIGEESWSRGHRPGLNNRFWLIDALDGTRAFVSGGSDYSVNLALISEGSPVLGIILAPRTGVMWTGIAGGGAFKTEEGKSPVPIRTRLLAAAPTVAVSRSRRDRCTDRFVADIGGATELRVGSSLKFCLVAEGVADVHLRSTTTHEWDTAAGQAILMAAGGAVQNAGREPLFYGKPGLVNGPFLAVGDLSAFERLPHPVFCKD